MSEHIIEIPDYVPPFDPAVRAVSLGEEVVRCRDCKFYEPESMTSEERGFGVYENVWEPGGCFNPERCSHGGDPFGEWYVIGINTDPDGYCAWGERRDA